MTLPLILGILGAAVTLYAFILNQLGKLNADAFIFDVYNLIGSIFLLVYAIDVVSWPFIITNVVWGLFSLLGIIQVLFAVKQPALKKAARKRR